MRGQRQNSQYRYCEFERNGMLGNQNSKSPKGRHAVPSNAGYEISGAKGRTQRMNTLVTLPKEPTREGQDDEPKKQRGTGLGEKEDEGQEAFEGIAETVDGGVAQLCSD